MNVNVKMRDRESLFFGAPDAPLFGCYHPSLAQIAKPWSVLFAYPMGQEYMRAHRAFLQLAVRLARTGFSSLRFDFSGCGDSFGEHEGARIEHWLNDMDTAVNELKSLSRSRSVCLIGMRMGATLATLTAAQQGGVECLVLWNPIVNGPAHRQELDALQKEMLRTSYVDAELFIDDQEVTEILGFPFSKTLLADVEEIDLLAMRQKPANQVLLIDSAEDGHIRPFAAHLERLGAQVHLRSFDGPKLWLEEPDNAVVPNEIWRDVVTWLSEVST